MRAINREIKSTLPFRIYSWISKLESESGLIEEIRLRRKRQAYVICSGKNIILPIIVTDNELDEIILAISHNSLYAYRDTIAKGYISLDDGVRVGIIGRASAENNEIVGVYDISELAFRIPNKLKLSVMN